MAMDAINSNFYMPPVNRLEGVGQGEGSRHATGIEGVHSTAGYNPFQELAGISGEAIPNYIDPAFAPTTYVNGINEHGRFSFMAMG